MDILHRLEFSLPDESSHELYCRCLDAAKEISKLRSECGGDTAKDAARWRYVSRNIRIAAYNEFVFFPLDPVDGDDLYIDKFTRVVDACIKNSSADMQSDTYKLKQQYLTGMY